MGKELTLKEIVERLEKLRGFNMESDEKFYEYEIRSLIHDVYVLDNKYFE